VLGINYPNYDYQEVTMFWYSRSTICCRLRSKTISRWRSGIHGISSWMTSKSWHLHCYLKWRWFSCLLCL